MRVPANSIKTNYTSGKEFVYSFNYKYYQGYYYELNSKFFVGKEFNVNAPELIKADSKKINTALTNSKTFIFSSISKITPNNSKPSSFLYDGSSTTRYFAKKINSNPILIKEINKITFDQFKVDPVYQTIFLSYDPKTGFNSVELEKANKTMIGLKEFLNNLNFNPASDTDSYSIGQG